MDIIEMVLVCLIAFFALTLVIAGALWRWHVNERRHYYGEHQWKRARRK